MKRKIILPVLLLFTIIILTLNITSVSFGQDVQTQKNSSVKLDNQNSAFNQTIYAPRGEVIAKGLLNISDLGRGYMGIFVQTLTHVPADKIKMKVFIDILDEDTMNWQTVQTFDFTYFAEDFADGDLSDPYEDFQVLAKKGRYYRLQAFHVVWKDGASESFTTATDGLLIS